MENQNDYPDPFLGGPTQAKHTEDGSNLRQAPIGRWLIPVFIGFYPTLQFCPSTVYLFKVPKGNQERVVCFLPDPGLRSRCNLVCSYSTASSALLGVSFVFQ